MPRDTQGHSVGAQTALTTAYSGGGAIEVKGVTGTDSRAQAIPNDCELGWLHGEIDTIAGGATTITWFISADAAGDIPITSEVTETILTGQTTATDGGIVTLIEKAWSLPSVGTQGSLWVWAKTDAGTANLTPRLFWERAG